MCEKGGKSEKRFGITSLYFTFSYIAPEVLSPLLLVGTGDGSLYLLAIKKSEATGLLDFTPVSSIKPKIPSRPIFLSVLDDVGQELDPKLPLGEITAKPFLANTYKPKTTSNFFSFLY